MSEIIHKIFKKLNNIITSNFEGGYESEPVRKAIIINLFAIIGFAFMTYFGIQTLLSYKIWYSLILFGFAIITVVNYIFLRISKNFIVAGHALVILMTVVEFFFIISGGVDKTGFLWYYTYPILSLFILGLKKGSLYIAFLFSITIGLFIIQPDFFPVYNHNLILRFVSSFLAVSLMAIVFEFVRSATYKTFTDADIKKTFYLNKVLEQQNELEQHKNHLEILVQERTTELEIAKEKAEESDKLKSAFLSNMSHEIRTPMNAIIGFSNLIIDPGVDQNLKREMVNHLLNSTNSLLHLMEDIIDVSKIEAGQMIMNIRSCNINTIMEDLYESYSERRIEPNKSQIQFIYENKFSNENLNILSDSSRIRQILSNILDNAFKFTEHGEIRFGYEKIIKDEKEYLKFFVKDTGIGLNEDQKKYIFRRFTKAEISKKKLYRGAGLGLSICKNMVEILGGEIWFESVIDIGSTFYFTLPIDTNIQNTAIQQVKNEVPEKINWIDKNILIADDEDSNFFYLKNLLSKTNALLYHVKNGQEAVDFVIKNKVDLIIMDIKMPVMNGLEATRIIKSTRKDIPIIALTAFTLENNEKISLDTGCDAYITKPLKEISLIKLLNEFFI
ncbi:MAG: hypothetical protein A2041_07510 [Bacteroidetes bacterium GWA2_31_9b]|nr:MAG: hypothetical protein A2041_07510 [Bacteroidetes bacterium GWA2_31_9b]